MLIKVGAAKRGQERRRGLRNAKKVEGGEDLGGRDSAGTSLSCPPGKQGRRYMSEKIIVITTP